MPTQLEILHKRLFIDGNTTNFHVSFGPNAHLHTAEELAAQLNASFDKLEASGTVSRNVWDTPCPTPRWTLEELTSYLTRKEPAL